MPIKHNETAFLIRIRRDDDAQTSRAIQPGDLLPKWLAAKTVQEGARFLITYREQNHVPLVTATFNGHKYRAYMVRGANPVP